MLEDIRTKEEKIYDFEEFLDDIKNQHIVEFEKQVEKMKSGGLKEKNLNEHHSTKKCEWKRFIEFREEDLENEIEMWIMDTDGFVLKVDSSCPDGFLKESKTKFAQQDTLDFSKIANLGEEDKMILMNHLSDRGEAKGILGASPTRKIYNHENILFFCFSEPHETHDGIILEDDEFYEGRKLMMMPKWAEENEVSIYKHMLKNILYSCNPHIQIPTCLEFYEECQKMVSEDKREKNDSEIKKIAFMDDEERNVKIKNFMNFFLYDILKNFADEFRPEEASQEND